MTKIVDQLEQKYFKLIEAFDKENEQAAFHLLKSIDNVIKGLQKLSRTDQEAIWLLLEQIFTLCRAQTKENNRDIKAMLHAYKIWQENRLLNTPHSLITPANAFAQIAQNLEVAHLLVDTSLFLNDSDDHLQMKLTQLVDGKKYRTALRYAMGLLERQPNIEGYLALRQIALKSAQHDQAEKYLQQAMDLKQTEHIHEQLRTIELMRSGMKQKGYHAIQLFRQAASGDTDHFVHEMAAIYLELQSNPAEQALVYQYALEGLYEEVRKRNDFPPEHAWRMASIHAEKNERVQATIAKEMAFYLVTDFAQLRVEDRALFIHDYVQWIQHTFLKRKDYFHAFMYWGRLLERESIDTLPIDDAFLNQLETAYIKREVAWPYAHKQLKSAAITPAVTLDKIAAKAPPAIEIKQPDSVRIPATIETWLQSIAMAIKNQKAPSKKTELQSTDVPGIERYIRERFQMFGHHQKYYPNVLQAIETLLTLIPFDEALHFKLAKLCLPEDAKRVYKSILVQNPAAIEAYAALAEMAYIQDKCKLAKEYIAKCSTLGEKTERLLEQITAKEIMWAKKLAKIRDARVNNPSDLAVTLKECEAFIRDKANADIYAETYLELGILKLLQEWKKSEAKSLEQFNQCIVDASGFEKVIPHLIEANALMPDSFEAVFWLGFAYKMAGKLFQAVLDNSWAITSVLFAARKAEFETSMTQYYADAKAQWIKAQQYTHPNRLTAIWELAQLQEQAGEFNDATVNYQAVSDGPSPYSQRARVKLAELNYKMERFQEALIQYQQMDQDEQFDNHLCTKTKIYCSAAMAANASGALKEAIRYMNLAKISAQQTGCHDFEGLQLLIGATDKKNYLAEIKNLVAGKPALSGLPVLVRYGKTFYFHDNNQGKLDDCPLVLSNIQPLLSEDGISLAPKTVLLLKSGDYSILYQHIQKQKGWHNPVLAWQSCVLYVIEEKLNMFREALECQMMAINDLPTTATNKHRFSCALPAVSDEAMDKEENVPGARMT